MNTLTRNWFHTQAAALIAAIIIAGFARTYYFAFLFDAPPLTWLMHLHGLTFSAWLVIHLVQARLIAHHRYAAHRALGITAAFVGLAMIVLGVIAWYGALERGHAPPGRDPFAFSAVSATSLVEFGLFLGAGARDEKETRMAQAAHAARVHFRVAAGTGTAVVRARGAIATVSRAARDLGGGVVLHRRSAQNRARAPGPIGWAAPSSSCRCQLRVWIGYTGPWQAFTHWLVQ
jgi:hypothetical protein